MKDFFIKIRRSKEASGGKLWKSSLHPAKEKPARRPRATKGGGGEGTQDSKVCAKCFLSYATLPLRLEV